jgi:hypothetical protein
VRHVVVDLRGLTFMDLIGLHERIRQNEFARSNRHNLAVVRGTDAIQPVLKLTGSEDILVLVDDPSALCRHLSRTDLRAGGASGHRHPAAASRHIRQPAEYRGG